MKRSLWKVQEQIFQHQIRLLDHELLTGQSAQPRTCRIREDPVTVIVLKSVVRDRADVVCPCVSVLQGILR